MGPREGMTGRADNFGRFSKWLKSFKTNFTKPNILSVASSNFLHFNSLTQSIAKVDFGATFRF